MYVMAKSYVTATLVLSLATTSLLFAPRTTAEGDSTTTKSGKRQAFSCEKACSLETCRLSTRCPFDGPYMCTSGDISGGCSTEVGLWPQTNGCDDCCDVSFCFVPCGKCNTSVCDGYTIEDSTRRRQNGEGSGSSSSAEATPGGGSANSGGSDAGQTGPTFVPPLCPAGIAPFACIEGPSRGGCSADRNLWPGVSQCWKCCDMQQCESFTPAPPTPPPPTPQPNCSDPDVSCNSEQEAAGETPVPPTPAPLPVKPTAADYSGNVWTDPDDVMLMCGKCQTDGGFTGSDSLVSSPTYFMLECDADLTGRAESDPTGTRIGTMKHRCEAGCGSCESETQVVLGERVRYFSNQFSASFSVPDTDPRAGIATSLHCCSHMLRVRSHNDARCNSDDQRGSDYYYPLGCQLGGRGTGEFQHIECPGHLAPPIVSPCLTRLGSWFEEQLGTFVTTPCPLISNEGYCPQGQYQVENSPCAKTSSSSTVSGAPAANISQFLGPEFYSESYYTMDCWVDQSQRCVRILRGDKYNESIANTSKPLGRIVEECVGGFVEAPATPSPDGGNEGNDVFVEGNGAESPLSFWVLSWQMILAVAGLMLTLI